MAQAGLAVFSEQRCWTGSDGIVYGRKNMGAVSGLPSIAPCTLIARSGGLEDVGEIVLPGQAGIVITPWPRAVTEFLVFFLSIASVWSTIGRHRAVTVYCPGILGTLAGLLALVRGRPIIVIAVGNPREALADAFPGIPGRIVKGIISGGMRILCQRAAVARYVTRETLQRAYPPGRSTMSFGITDVGTPALGRARSSPERAPCILLTVASLDQTYKGIAELIEAVAWVRSEGIDVHLNIAGTGRLRPGLEKLASAKLGTSFTFLGHLSGKDLEREYSAAHYFALPSWMEGLSRALVEAMAAGLPAVGTDVGGASELLEPHRLVPPRDSDALGVAIKALILDAGASAASSSHNLFAAQKLIAQAAADEPAFLAAVAECVA